MVNMLGVQEIKPIFFYVTLLPKKIVQSSEHPVFEWKLFTLNFSQKIMFFFAHNLN